MINASRLKIAFMGIPYLGGNYTHFKYLADGLPNYDWTLLQVGKIEHSLLDDILFVHIGAELDRVIHARELAFKLIAFLKENAYDILIPMNSAIAISVIPYLPQSLQIINIVNSDTQRVYKAVSEYYDFVSKIICISPKQINVLEVKENVRKKLKLIPHGVQIQSGFVRPQNDLIRIGFLGRIHHEHKGVLLIPKILQGITDSFIFEIIGDGPDKQTLLNELEGYNINYNFWGFKKGLEKEKIISQWDIMLFPSYIEGFGLTLIEVMKYGVIPIANEIKGITDYIITDKIDGFIVPANNIDVFKSNIKILLTNPVQRSKMSVSATKTIEEKYNLDVILDEYRTVFAESLNYKKPKILDFTNWTMYQEYCPSLIVRIQLKLKYILNQFLK
ncbi:glycosyltransferase family 4 protein [Epilithonimonas hominis]|uniref:Glycosyltransferase n=1 Tax=Epilithonimonas hominis TaxID=420404 RepID=A0A3N0X6G0_9FLAO|nr:glycosyltransferase family 4 protein [Epilithonimonas hominis]ROI12942.1 glycosyltransferase [Epilithonimonas hominis]